MSVKVAMIDCGLTMFERAQAYVSFIKICFRLSIFY